MAVYGLLTRFYPFISISWGPGAPSRHMQRRSWSHTHTSSRILLLFQRFIWCNICMFPTEYALLLAPFISKLILFKGKISQNLIKHTAPGLLGTKMAWYMIRRLFIARLLNLKKEIEWKPHSRSHRSFRTHGTIMGFKLSRRKYKNV